MDTLVSFTRKMLWPNGELITSRVKGVMLTPLVILTLFVGYMIYQSNNGNALQTSTAISILLCIVLFFVTVFWGISKAAEIEDDKSEQNKRVDNAPFYTNITSIVAVILPLVGFGMFANGMDGLLLKLSNYSTFIGPLLAAPIIYAMLRAAPPTLNKIIPKFILVISTGIGAIIAFSLFESNYVLPTVTSTTSEKVLAVAPYRAGVLGMKTLYRIETPKNKYVIAKDIVKTGGLISVENRKSLDELVSGKYLCSNSNCSKSQ